MTKDPGFSRTPDLRERRAMFINDMLATARNLFPGNPHLSHAAPDKWLTTCLRPELRAVLETLTEAAKALHAKRNALYGYLESHKWVTRGKSRQATASALRSGYMDTRTHTDPRGRVHTTPVVTPKGFAYLAQIKAKRTI